MFIAALKPIFHVLMKCLALSTPVSCEREEWVKKHTKSGLRKLQKFTSIMNWWPWLLLAMGGGPAEAQGAAQGVSSAAQLLHEDLGE